MRLYMLIGSRHQALRQYQSCTEVLHRELDVEPGAETKTLHEEILARHLAAEEPTRRERPAETMGLVPLPPALRWTPSTPFVGRERAMGLLHSDLMQAAGRRGATVLIGGETGVGKTRLAAEAVRRAHAQGVLVLWGASYEQEGQFRYGPFVEALEGYVSALSESERGALARSYAEVAQSLPSLALGRG